MPVNVNVGFSRKVGEPNYGSRGASVHLEVELDGGALNDPERLRTEIETIFERARDAVDRELQREVSPVSESGGPSDGQPGHHGQNGHAKAARPATPNQIRAMQTIARHRAVDLCQLLDARFNGKTAEELTVVEASLLIDKLKSFPTPGDGDLTAVSWQ
jgi:hypothetical protein